MYRIREVDGQDDEIAETLADLHRLTFFDGAPVPEFEKGHWWLAFHETVPVGFAGIVSSSHAFNAGYFCRVGVLRRHCGNALQRRFMRAVESLPDIMDGAAWFRIPPTILPLPTTSSGPAIGFTGRHIHGPGPTRCIGASLSGKRRRHAIRACTQAIANIALLEIDLTVASPGANRGQKGRNRS
jgi:hypothetical protein